jgi:transketolase
MSLNIEFGDKTFENKQRPAKEFAKISLELRRDIIKMLVLAKSGHTGGPLGLADFMAVLYFGNYMKYSAKSPEMADRDRFVLSGGHLVPVLYSVLARAGYFAADELSTLRKYGSRLQGHPGLDTHLPGLETSSGSLGQGISIAVGMAMSDKLVDKNERKVFCLTGDGEIQEGSVWEAAMAASNYKLDNLCWIVDNNDCQIDGRVKDVMSIYPITDKFKAFGFKTIEIDGNNLEQIIDALNEFNANHENKIAQPTVIILKTIMGKGVSFMEDLYGWHGNPPNEAQAEQALAELV